MNNKLCALLFGSLVSTVAGAANDPDSIGRSIKYLDYSVPVGISVYTQTCPFANPTPTSRCVKLAGTDSERFEVADIAEIDVAAGSRSLIDYIANPLVSVAVRNTTPTRKNTLINLQLTLTVESEVLNDPALLNPVTGTPFYGKLVFGSTMMLDSRSLDSGQFASVQMRPSLGTTAGLLNRKQLTQVYGLSSTVARQLLTRPMKIRLGLSGISSSALNSMTTVVSVRLLSD